ncbi:hypothetical protein E8E12_004177 [Didymella heteroderae]|uniref:Wax synthase domain-containing protein n=1 Tax=Didymella heteroderae TaxID=1769908 RepID=A0A9P5BX04_9PLEO|nr:hypothetical protein E8E12_004177 [Didymella heteroderae]
MAFQLPLIFTTLQPLLIIASNVLTLAIGPQRRVLQFAFSVPVLFLFAAQSLYRDWDRGWGLHYGLNCFVVTNLFVWFDWVVLNSPYREGWIKLDQRKSSEVPRDESTGSSPERAAFPKDDGGVVQSKSAVQKQRHGVPETFWGRLCWAARLSTTNRYIGWSCEVKNAPSSVPSTYPRWKFLVRKSLRFALFYALKDAMYSYTAASPHGTWLDLHPSVPVIGFDASPFRDRLYWTWVYIALTYVSLELMCTLYSLISVAAFMASPSECPRMFNDLSECYSMRRAWSVVWHQQMRRVCSAPGIWAARDALKLTRGSFSSKYTQLFVGFAPEMDMLINFPGTRRKGRNPQRRV